MTDYCTSSVRHQNGYGERDYQYNSSLKAIKKLDLLFPKQPIKEKQGLYLEFYPDGRPRLSERYEHGRLNGERKAYYSNGQLMLLECYAKGIREEECIWWYRNGKMKKECYYRKGQLVDKIVHYSEKNGKPRVIHYYSPEGDFLRTEKFNE